MSRHILYRCAICHTEVKITQAEGGSWLGQDLSGRTIIMPEGARPPMPSHWVEFGGSYYCPEHELAFHGTGTGTGKVEHFYVFRGLNDGIRAL